MKGADDKYRVRLFLGRFDEAAFQQALKDSRVDSITLFAKCHHSWSYYPTQVGRPHPHLTTDLLGRQIEACRRIGVRCPIYITVGWSSNDAADHPEWCVQKPDGTFLTQNLDLDAADDAARPWVSWVCLWPGGGYGDLIVEQTREICRTFDVDGLFYDICPVRPNYAPAVKREMVDAGVDVSDPVAVQRYALGVWAKFTQRCRDVLFERHPAATIYFNGNSAWNTPEVMLQRQTHFELEHMPSVWGGGYDHFPMRVRALHVYDSTVPNYGTFSQGFDATPSFPPGTAPSHDASPASIHVAASASVSVTYRVPVSASASRSKFQRPMRRCATPAFRWWRVSPTQAVSIATSTRTTCARCRRWRPGVPRRRGCFFRGARPDPLSGGRFPGEGPQSRDQAVCLSSAGSSR